MEAVWNSQTEDMEDYYGLLGCDELSTTEQILNEYKIRALACHPDKNLEDAGADSGALIEHSADEATGQQIIFEKGETFLKQKMTGVADFQKLQEAKDVLCDYNKRKNYDLWKRSGVAIPFHDWQALKDTVKTSMHWAMRNKKEPMLEASKAEIPVTSKAERTSAGDTAPSRGYFHPPYHWVPDSTSSLLQKFRNYEI